MTFSSLRKFLASILLTMGLLVAGFAAPAFAQAPGDANDPATTVTTDDDNDFDWGWLGLLGLIGLAGLAGRRDRDRVTTRDTTGPRT